MEDGHESESSVPTSSLEHFLSFDNSKSLYIWSGSFEDLLRFAEQELDLENFTQSTSDRAYSIKIKNSVTLTLFKSTHTLQILGTDAKLYKDKLNALICGDDRPDDRVEETINDSEVSITEISDSQTSRHSAKDAAMLNEARNVQFSVLQEDLSCLRSEVSKLWDFLKPHDGSHWNTTFKSVIAENESYKQQIRQLEHERDSLKTALYILAKDLNNVKPNNVNLDNVNLTQPSISTLASERQDETTEVSKKATKKKKKKKGKKNQQDTSTQPSIQSSTQSSTRSCPSIPTDPPSHQRSNSRNKSDDSEPQRKQTTVIAGDSLVKNIIGAKMSSNDPNNFFIVKPFPGATVSDMEDFVKPLTRRSPDKVILHVGTNDLRSLSPQNIATAVMNLVTQISEDSPTTTVGVSGLLVRSDNADLAHKVQQVNTILRNTCNRNNIPFLANDNITVRHLNSRGLHLSKHGSEALQENFRNFSNVITSN